MLDNMVKTYSSNYHISTELDARLDSESYLEWYRGYAAGMAEYGKAKKIA